MDIAQVPKATVQRFTLYVQTLEGLARTETMISSQELADACGLTPSQVRRDLAWFGGIGRRGSGYDARSLLDSLKSALGVDRTWKAALVGPTSLGRAILFNANLPYRGLDIVAVFSCDSPRLGHEIGGIEILPLGCARKVVPALGVEIGIIATAAEQAQSTANTLVQAGVSGLLCYAPVRIQVRPEVAVHYIDIFQQFFALTFAIGLNRPRLPMPVRRRMQPQILPASKIAAPFAIPGRRKAGGV